MGAKLSKTTDQQQVNNHQQSPPPAQQTDSSTAVAPDLSSYEAACRADPELRSFDVVVHERATRAINSVAVGLEVRSLSLDSLREVTECLLEMNQEVVNVILQSRKDIWSNEELFDFVNDYFKNSLHTLDFCTELEACIKRALHSQSIIKMALVKFEEECQEGSSENLYARTLEELRNFKAAGDPFTEGFFSIFLSVSNQQIVMLDKLRAKKRKLDKRLKSVKAWRRISNVIFVATFIGVIVCSIVAAAITAPPVVTALAAAASVPLGSMGKWINSIWGKCEKELRGQREIISSMQIGSYIVIKDLDSIRALVHRLQIEIEALIQNADFAMREDEAVMIAVEEIKKKVDGFMKTIQDLSEHADKCSRDIKMARAVILRRILNYPSNSNNGSGLFF